MGKVYSANKSPAEDFDYKFAWATDLAVGETITGAVWTSDVGVTLHDPYISGTNTGTYVSGGTLGQRYRVDCVITTNNNPARKFDAAVWIKVLGK